MRRAVHYLPLLLIYAVFLVSGTLYLRGLWQYRGIESWPSVPAEIVESGGVHFSTPFYGRFGLTTNTVDSRFVGFEYTVNGETFQSRGAPPYQGNLSFPESRKAYYNPAAPHIAVLNPVPFQSDGLLITAVFTGILVFGHLWFTVPAFLSNFRRAGKP
ncbi:MAG: hypothetical protein P1U89_22625 [Verrucomicrobiales bacterium]|nr:hypothetical protein [Verrucomicrobiales bacterium]